MHYGFLFLALFTIFPASGDARLPISVSPAVSRKLGSPMGRPPARNFRTPSPDIDIHISEYGLQQCMVRGPFDRDDPGLFRRRTRNTPAAKANTGRVMLVLRQ